MKNVKELDAGFYIITLPKTSARAERILKKSLETIHQHYGGFEYIPLAHYKNGQLKTLCAFCKETIG